MSRTGREEELIGPIVLRSCEVPLPKAIPHRPLSLIIFPCGVVRDPIKLPVVALKALMRRSCKFPTNTALLTGPNCAGAHQIPMVRFFVLKILRAKREGCPIPGSKLGSKRDGRQPLDQSREGQSGAKSAESLYQAHLKGPTLTVASEPGRPVSKLLISRPSSVAPQFQIRMKLGLVTIDLLPLSLY